MDDFTLALAAVIIAGGLEAWDAGRRLARRRGAGFKSVGILTCIAGAGLLFLGGGAAAYGVHIATPLAWVLVGAAFLALAAIRVLTPSVKVLARHVLNTHRRTP